MKSKMISWKYFVVVLFIVSFVAVCTESKGGRGGGGFRSGGFRSSSRSGSSSRGWFSSWSSSRRSSSVVTSRPATSYRSGVSNTYSSNTHRSSDSYGSNGYGSGKAASVVTNKPSANYGPQYYGFNNHASHGKASAAETATQRSSKIATTPRSYDRNQQQTSGSTYYSGRSGYRRRNNTGGEQLPPQVYHNDYHSGYYQKSSGTRNAVLAGVGGSALGMFLGYQLGSMSNSYNPNSPNSGNDNTYPPYSVVHHYHHGENPIIQNGKVEENIITQCNNITFCAPKTQPLCLTNGTVYCLAPMSTATNCIVNSTTLNCIKTTLTAPCLNDTASNCSDSSSLKNVTVEIPCVTNLYVMGDFTTGKLKVYQVGSTIKDNSGSIANSNSTNVSTGDNAVPSNSTANTNSTDPTIVGTNSTENSNSSSTVSSGNITNTTLDITPAAISSSGPTVATSKSLEDSNSTVQVNLNSTTSNPIVSNAEGVSTTSDATTITEAPPKFQPSLVTGQGIANEFCVVVIAEPIKEPPLMTNAQFFEYVNKNDEAREKMYAKFETILDNLLH